MSKVKRPRLRGSTQKPLSGHKRLPTLFPLGTLLGSGAGVPIGGSIVSIYDGHDEPTEARVLDPAGQIVTRFVRTFDSNGRVVEVNQERENPGLMFAGMFSDEERARLDDKGMEALNKGAKAMFSGLRGSGSSYAYDAH